MSNMETGHDSQIALLRECLQGNEAAVNLCLHLNHVINIWDDLVDRDKPVSPGQIHSAFIAAVVHIPRNPFYQQFREELQPVMEMAITSWQASLALEEDFRKGDTTAAAKAYVLRFETLNIFVMCARLIGGLDWASECATRLYRAFPPESLDDYTMELLQ